MFCIDNRCTDIYFNLAAEEYLLKQKGDNFFMLWQSVPSVVVGKHQSVEAEVNMEYVKQHHIHLARRFSGGGAVYHDSGNVNLTFIGTDAQPNFENYLQQTVDCLTAVGLTTYTDQRLGIYIGNEKISGSAQFIHKNRILYHCTLLFDTDLLALEIALQGKGGIDNMLSNRRKVRAVPSVRSAVTNISRYMDAEQDIRRFARLVFRYFLDDEEGANRIYHYSREDVEAIEHLKCQKYSCPEWIMHAQLSSKMK